MNSQIPPPQDAPEWFKKWCNEFNRQNQATNNQSQGKTNPTTNIQTFSASSGFTTDGSSAIIPINILNKLPVNARNVVLASIARTDGAEITGTPQITWTMNGTNITILTIGGLAANTSYSATFSVNI